MVAQLVYKVLIATDFSDSAREAVRYVVTTLHPRPTHLYILHAYKHSAPESVPLVSLVDILREKSERLMSRELSYLRSLPHGGGLAVTPIHRFDTVLQSIVDVAEQEGVDLVVMGVNGRATPQGEPRDDDPTVLMQRLNRPLLLVPKLLN